MAFPTVERCFCCLSLRTAGFLMGLVAIVVDLASIYLYVIIKKVNETSSNDNTVGKWEIVMSCVGLLINLCWIYGIHRKRPKPMLPFLVLAFIAAVALILAPFGSLFYFSATNANPLNGTIAFFFLCCLGGLAFYLLIVQYSLYKLIRKSAVEKDEDNNGL